MQFHLLKLLLAEETAEPVVPTFKDVAKAVYDFAFANMKLPPEIKADAKLLAAQTDNFHTDNIHDIIRKIKDGHGIEDILDELADAADDVIAKVVEYYGDPMNHPPGYKQPNIKAVQYSDITAKELRDLLEKISPGLVAYYDEMNAASKSRAEQKTKDFLATAKQNIQDVADFVNKHNDAGWEDFFNCMKKTKDQHVRGYFPDGVTLALIRAFKNGKDIESFFKTRSQKEYLTAIVDNFFNLDGFSKQDQGLIKMLSALKENPNDSKDLIKLLK